MEITICPHCLWLVPFLSFLLRTAPEMQERHHWDDSAICQPLPSFSRFALDKKSSLLSTDWVTLFSSSYICSRMRQSELHTFSRHISFLLIKSRSAKNTRATTSRSWFTFDSQTESMMDQCMLLESIKQTVPPLPSPTHSETTESSAPVLARVFHWTEIQDVAWYECWIWPTHYNFFARRTVIPSWICF